MFKISIGHSLTADPDAAAASLAEQVLRKLDGFTPTAALLFSTTGRNHAGLLQQLTRLLPGCPIVGGSSNGEVSREQGYRLAHRYSLHSPVIALPSAPVCCAISYLTMTHTTSKRPHNNLPQRG